MGCGAAVQPDIAYPHTGTSVARIGLQFAAHHRHEISQPNFQGGKVSSAMDTDDLVHHIVQASHLFEAQHCQPLLRIRAVGAIAVAIIVVSVAVAVAVVVVVVDIVGTVVVITFIVEISIADTVGLIAVHLAERLHHSDPTLAFLADLQGATLQQSQGTGFLRDSFSIEQRSLREQCELMNRIIYFNKNNYPRENACRFVNLYERETTRYVDAILTKRLFNLLSRGSRIKFM